VAFHGRQVFTVASRRGYLQAFFKYFAKNFTKNNYLIIEGIGTRA